MVGVNVDRDRSREQLVPIRRCQQRGIQCLSTKRSPYITLTPPAPLHQFSGSKMAHCLSTRTRDIESVGPISELILQIDDDAKTLRIKRCAMGSTFVAIIMVRGKSIPPTTHGGVKWVG